MTRFTLAVLILESLEVREIGLVNEVHQRPQLLLDVLHRCPRHQNAVLVRVDTHTVVHNLGTRKAAKAGETTMTTIGIRPLV